MNRRVFKSGVSVIEAIVGSAILALVLFAFTSSLSLYSAASTDATRRTQALFLAEEGLEIARGLRDASWNNIGSLETEKSYGLDFNEGAGRWEVTENSGEIGIFVREISFGDVYRNDDDEITDGSPSTYDAGSRFVKVEVSWPSRRGEQAVVLESLLTNSFQN